MNPAVADAASQAIRANLVSQYNGIIAQISTTAQDASFNGINLLNGDTLKLTFNETGKSSLSVQGVTFSSAGLGLGSLTNGTDFLDSTSANNVLAALGSASTSLVPKLRPWVRTSRSCRSVRTFRRALSTCCRPVPPT